jgi:CSLREA domain-containing protein
MKRLLMLLVAVVAGLLVVPSAGAVTINVTTVADDYGASPGTCSLREAITAAQTDSGFDGCAAGAGADTVSLPGGTYLITRPGADEDLNVTGDLDVVGTGTLSIEPANDNAKVVLDANQIDRVYDQQGNNSLTIKNQHVFGGVLTLIGDDGAGIRNAVGQLTVEGTTISSNRTDFQGGGVAVYSNLAMINSTITGNEANGNGGGIYAPGGAAVSVRSSTITGNSADMDANDNGQGGGFADGGASSISFTNVINAGNFDRSPNQAGATPDCSSGPAYFPDFTIQVQPFAAGNCLIGFDPGTNKTVTDPLLGALQDNGGQTPTIALLPGSPAIGAGAPSPSPDACPATDQTGRPRPADGCDIGAVQFIPPPPPRPNLLITRIVPKAPTVRLGRTVTVTLAIRNFGSAAAIGVRVCLLLDRKARRALETNGRPCRKLGTIAAGQLKKARIGLSAKRSARKRGVTVVSTVKAKELQVKSRQFTVRLR